MAKDKSNQKIRKIKKIAKPCTECFSPIYLKFNFAYISYDAGFKGNSECEAQFLRRMRELSRDVYTVILSRGKQNAFEFVHPNKLKSFNRQIPLKFSARFPEDKYGGKLAIMRLYPNNNPTPARIIGVVIKNVFYVMFIDIKGNIYDH